MRDRIFQPFVTTRDVGSGTGLGLSAARGIIEAHGGRLTLEASTTGARFRILLPALKETDLTNTA